MRGKDGAVENKNKREKRQIGEKHWKKMQILQNVGNQMETHDISESRI